MIDQVGANSSYSTFWDQVRRRRNVFLWVWIGWLPIGGLAITLYAALFGHEAPRLFGYSFFYLYVAIWAWTAFRLRQLRCPVCGYPAISHPLFFMRDAKCRHCGLPYKRPDTATTPHRD